MHHSIDLPITPYLCLSQFMNIDLTGLLFSTFQLALIATIVYFLCIALSAEKDRMLASLVAKDEANKASSEEQAATLAGSAIHQAESAEEAIRLGKRSRLGVIRIILLVLLLATLMYCALLLTLKMAEHPAAYSVFNTVANVFFTWIFMGIALPIVFPQANHKVLNVLASATAGFTVLMSIFSPTSLTFNLIGMVTTVAIMVLFDKIPLRFLLIFALGSLTYDIYAVFHTGEMMEAVEKTMDFAPGCYLTFYSLEDFKNGMLSYGEVPTALLGYGDVVIPGFLLLSMYRNAKEKFPEIAKRIFVGTLISFIIGLVLSGLACEIFQTGQPALIYLVPCVLLGFVISTWSFAKVKKLVSA